MAEKSHKEFLIASLKDILTINEKEKIVNITDDLVSRLDAQQKSCMELLKKKYKFSLQYIIE